jgi:alternative ribosome-rescue factor
MEQLEPIVAIDGRAAAGVAIGVTQVFARQYAGALEQDGYRAASQASPDSTDQLDVHTYLSHDRRALPTHRERPAMSKPKKRPNKAKSIIAQPLFRSRQEQPTKGKGSYRREAFQSRDWEASSVMAA